VVLWSTVTTVEIVAGLVLAYIAEAWRDTISFLRATAVLRARISYGNSVRPSVRLSVTTRYAFKATW